LHKVPSSSVIISDATGIVGGNVSGNGAGNIVLVGGCDNDDKHSPINMNTSSTTTASTTSSILDHNESVEIEIRDVAFDDASGEGESKFSILLLSFSQIIDRKMKINRSFVANVAQRINRNLQLVN
jgi:hypothetical protein